MRDTYKPDPSRPKRCRRCGNDIYGSGVCSMCGWVYRPKSTMPRRRNFKDQIRRDVERRRQMLKNNQN